MPNIGLVAEAADMIVDGYAFTVRDDGIAVLNLNHPDRASFYSLKGELIETSMDDIELVIVREYFDRNREFLEVGVA